MVHYSPSDGHICLTNGHFTPNITPLLGPRDLY